MESASRRRTLAMMTAGLLALSALPGCAAAGGPGLGAARVQPRLYPNRTLDRVGIEVAEMDVAECLHQADRTVPPPSLAERAAIRTVGGAAGGAALGAIAGAIAGDPGTGAAAGAAIGATAGLLRTAWDSGRPDARYRGWAEACLRDKGYEVAGWW
jgi:hypothetical protein